MAVPEAVSECEDVDRFTTRISGLTDSPAVAVECGGARPVISNEYRFSVAEVAEPCDGVAVKVSVLSALARGTLAIRMLKVAVPVVGDDTLNTTELVPPETKLLVTVPTVHVPAPLPECSPAADNSKGTAPLPGDVPIVMLESCAVLLMGTETVTILPVLPITKPCDGEKFVSAVMVGVPSCAAYALGTLKGAASKSNASKSAAPINRERDPIVEIIGPSPKRDLSQQS